MLRKSQLSIVSLFMSLSLLMLINPAHAFNPFSNDKQEKAMKHQVSPKFINVNQANASELSKQLKLVGKQKARRIVEYREKNGPFKEKKDLMKVKGFGKKVLKSNESRISLK